MNQEKIHLINKLFNNSTIRTVWDKEDEKYYISVVDIVGILSGSKDRQSYWRKLKQRLKEEENKTVTNCHALKLKAQDGKSYKGLRKESLRDNMSDIEIALADIGELTTRELAKKHRPIGLEENRKIAKEGGLVASNTRKDIESRLGESVITQENMLNYQYIDNKKIE